MTRGAAPGPYPLSEEVDLRVRRGDGRRRGARVRRSRRGRTAGGRAAWRRGKAFRRRWLQPEKLLKRIERISEQALRGSDRNLSGGTARRIRRRIQVNALFVAVAMRVNIHGRQRTGN